jgi:peptidyl-prolyl cis-trans isomerase D
MLTTIREKTQGWFAGTVLVLIAALFVVGGVASYFESDSKIVVARVGSHDISSEAYKTALEDQRRSLQENLGRNLDPKLFDNLEFKTRILDNLVDQSLLVRDAEDQGYRISEAELDQRITSMPVFQREGRFEPKLYELVLRGMNMSPQGLKQRLRQEAVTKQVADGFELSTLVTNNDIDTLIRLETQSRLASYVVIKPQQYRQVLRRE